MTWAENLNQDRNPKPEAGGVKPGGDEEKPSEDLELGGERTRRLS